MALTNDDLQAIGQLMDEKMDQKIEDLSIQVANGFEEVFTRFDRMEVRQDEMDLRITVEAKRNDKQDATLELVDHKLALVK